MRVFSDLYSVRGWFHCLILTVLSYFVFLSHRKVPQTEMHRHDYVRILLRHNFASVVSAKKVLNKVDSAEIDLYIKKASYLVASSWSDIHSFSTWLLAGVLFCSYTSQCVKHTCQWELFHLNTMYLARFSLGSLSQHSQTTPFFIWDWAKTISSKWSRYAHIGLHLILIALFISPQTNCKRAQPNSTRLNSLGLKSPSHEPYCMSSPLALH